MQLSLSGQQMGGALPADNIPRVNLKSMAWKAANVGLMPTLLRIPAKTARRRRGERPL